MSGLLRMGFRLVGVWASLVKAWGVRRLGWVRGLASGLGLGVLALCYAVC